MARYIDADKLLKEFEVDTSKEVMDISDIVFGAVTAIIEKQPTADVVEVKHGEWIPTKTEFGWNCCEYPVEYTCSVCGRTEPQEEPYCHCGAKMDG